MNKMPLTRPSSILIVEDHVLTRRGFIVLLEGSRRFHVMGEAETLAEARHSIETAVALPDLVILDIRLKDENGLDFLKFLDGFCKTKKILPIPVLICSAFDETFRIQAALRDGAKGYLTKGSSEAEVFAAIDAVLSGETYIDEQALPAPVAPKKDRFTRREIEVLDLIKRNWTTRQIAAALDISLRTVENYISRIYLKTGCNTREELLKR